MSIRLFFDLSEGLSKPLRVPSGTLDQIRARVREVERRLGLETEQYKDNPPRWKYNDFSDVSDDVLCEAAEAHNTWVRYIYEQFGKWSKTPVEGGEMITPDQARMFWHGLRMIDVPAARWTSAYYRARMESLYEVMRGRESEGMTFDARALTPAQAGAVIVLLSGWLDCDDIRLDVPNGRDELRASSDGGYEWCETCGAVAQEEVEHKLIYCRKRGCALRQEYGTRRD